MKTCDTCRFFVCQTVPDIDGYQMGMDFWRLKMAAYTRGMSGEEINHAFLKAQPPKMGDVEEHICRRFPSHVKVYLTHSCGEHQEKTDE